MKRVQLFEFEDFDWFPSALRTSMTHLIVVFLKMMGTKEVLAKLIKYAKSRIEYKQIIDMGSGSGSAMMMAVQSFNRNNESPINLILTDLHPNPKFIERINQNEDDHVQYREQALDATNLAQTPQGLKTMVNSFHHMTPDMAKAVLKSAHDNKQALLIYELAENKIPVVLWALLLPISIPILMIMVLFMTPFVRPLTWQQIVFTYFIPIIPFCYAWDGQASLPRTYSFSDIKSMTTELKDNYTWEIQAVTNVNGKKSGYYVLGTPVNP